MRNPGTVPAGISCIRTGFCTAVGIYSLSATLRLAVVADEVNGRWPRGFRASSPPNAQIGANAFSVLAAVACVARHTCVASGAYVDSSGNEQGMAVTLTLPCP